MARTHRLDYKEIAHARLNGRLRQGLILMLSIVIGILISISINS
jgi:hypothetical protein